MKRFGFFLFSLSLLGVSAFGDSQIASSDASEEDIIAKLVEVADDDDEFTESSVQDAALPVSAHASKRLTGKIWQPDYINGIVAVVNDRVVTAGELRQEMAPLLEQIERQVHSQEEFDARLNELSLEVLNSMIDRILVIQEFERRGYQIPKVQKSAQLDDFIQKQFGGDRLRFTEQLHEYGKSLQRFRKEMEESFIVNIMLNRIHQSRAEISPSQIEEFYAANREQFYLPEAVKVWQIQLPADKDFQVSEDENHELSAHDVYEIPSEMQTLYERLQQGESFESVAKKQGKNAYLGDDWLSRKELQPALAERLFAMGPSTFTEPVLVDDMAVIFYVLDHRDGRQQSIEEVQETIEMLLLQQRVKEAQQEWIKSLRDGAYVQIYL